MAAKRAAKLDPDLERAIGRYSEPVAATARAALAKLRSQFPGARLLVYERPRNLPIGLAAASGPALFSIVLYSRWVRFFFLEGVLLDDPEGRLEGTGNQVRSLKLDDKAAVLDDPYIQRLMAQCIAEAAVDLKKGSGEVVFKSRIAK